MTFTKHIAPIITCLALISTALLGQDDLIRKAQKLHTEYRFREAADLYRQAVESITDSTRLFDIEQEAVLSENGINFLRYVSVPVTVAKKNAAIKDIPLWLPELDGGWVSVPNGIVSAASDFQKYTFFPEGDRIIYSDQGIDGSFDLFEITRETGTQWSAPAPIDGINTSGNEIFPFVSSDGRSLWFASDGHAGIGGYDLFVSKWNDAEQKWSLPENLGFPYSSTADDILYFNTPDGNWSVLASTRSADAGTATIYIMEFDVNPIKTSVSDLFRIQQIALLEPAGTEAKTSVPSQQPARENSQTDAYTSAVLDMQAIQKSYQEILNSLDQLRSEYEQSEAQANRTQPSQETSSLETMISQTNSQLDAAVNQRRSELGQSEVQAKRTQLSQEISSLEAKAALTKSQLDAAREAVRKAEMDLLKNGIIPPAVETPEEKPSSETGTAPTYKFTRIEPMPSPDINTRIPEPVFNYTFRIQETTEFAPEEVLTDGLYYQVQMVVLSSQPKESGFKGIAPVFVRKSSGHYICSAGAFRIYEDAVKAVSKIRAKGFSQAFVTAYSDGKKISVKTARLQEKSAPAQSYNVTLSGYADGLPSIVKSTISANCSKDLAKSLDDGKVIYIIGPFSSRTEAESLLTALEAVGADKVSIETVAK